MSLPLSFVSNMLQRLPSLLFRRLEHLAFESLQTAQKIIQEIEIEIIYPIREGRNTKVGPHGLARKTERFVARLSYAERKIFISFEGADQVTLVEGHPGFLRWVGSKRWLAQQIEELLPVRVNHYYEPFLGSGSVFLAICGNVPSFGSDLNEELINAFKIVRDSPDQLMSKINEFDDGKSAYLEIRAWDRQKDFSSLPLLDRAARFVYLNHTSFNGLHRVNSSGSFNVPFGDRSPSWEKLGISISNASKRLKKGLELAGKENLNARAYGFSDLALEEGDFVYLDPPYVNRLREKSFVSYTQNRFTPQDTDQLISSLKSIDEAGANFLFSNFYEPELVEKLSSLGFRVELRHVTHKVGSKTESRKLKKEVLARNYVNA